MSIRSFFTNGWMLRDRDPVSTLDMLAADHWRAEIQAYTGDRDSTEAYMAVAARLAMVGVPVRAIDQFAIDYSRRKEQP